MDCAVVLESLSHRLLGASDASHSSKSSDTLEYLVIAEFIRFGCRDWPSGDRVKGNRGGGDELSVSIWKFVEERSLSSKKPARGLGNDLGS